MPLKTRIAKTPLEWVEMFLAGGSKTDMLCGQQGARESGKFIFPDFYPIQIGF